MNVSVLVMPATIPRAGGMVQVSAPAV